ncbi:hypothetical protein EAI_13226 [Harpegnathos saltator]|uniref:Uncharacterized protein n=1 Tax=Harpegnathos saltator TaxID=610380 RepID=E2BTQ3_HARSA|nr:hypothetical protein EAI_13226 [Harpegnathos saltator]
MLLCTTYALNNLDTKRVQVGLRTMYDEGTFEPAIKMMGNTASGIFLDLNTWEKFKDIIPSANSYLRGENKGTLAPIFINDITISSAYGARAIMVSQRGKMEGESGPAKKTSEGSTHLKQPPLKKRKLYTKNIVMQETPLDGLETIVKYIDVKCEHLQSVAALYSSSVVHKALDSRARGPRVIAVGVVVRLHDSTRARGSRFESEQDHRVIPKLVVTSILSICTQYS